MSRQSGISRWRRMQWGSVCGNIVKHELASVHGRKRTRPSTDAV
jgi:hypothetical protein